MKIGITDEELTNYSTIEECIKAKGIISDFDIVEIEHSPIQAKMTITIREKKEAKQ